nr:sigma 54-interacting transcriptional regulator [Kofleriaceae bacterium]
MRRLRADRTRSELARLVGVNAHTVYRWELPAESPHARRPRGQVLARLERLAHAPTSASSAPASAQPATPIAAAVEHLLDGLGTRDEESLLLRAASDREASVESRSLAATAVALADLVLRGDGRRALATLAVALAPDSPPFALAEAAAALAYSYPDGELFDLGRVHAHARRAEELARTPELGPGAATAFAIAAMAVGNAALLAGDDDLMLRALARIDTIAPTALPELVALYLELFRSYDATLAGQPQLALERLDRVIAHPRVAVSPSLHARALAIRGMRQLDNLGDPEEALALARRSRQLAADERVPVGVHSALALRAEAEALMRLGRLAEVPAVLAESDRILVELRFPVTPVMPIQIRYLLATHQADALAALASRLSAIELPSMRAISQAHAAWLDATAKFVRGDDAAATLDAYAHAERLASGWGILRRDLLVSYASAMLCDGELADLGEARAVLARANRANDRRPSAWVTANLRRMEGTLRIDEGRVDDGLTLMDAAAATFVAAGDRVAAAMVRYGTAGVRGVIGAADADARTAEAVAELAAIGLSPPRWIDRAISRAREAAATGAWTRVAPAAVSLAPGFELALQRLAVAGATPQIVVHELAAIARELAGVDVVVEVHRDDEAGHGVCGDADPRTVADWFELGGARRARLGVAHAVADDVRASLRVLALVAGLALEVAALRAGERTPAAPDPAPELPGVIAVSAPMRRLVGDAARLAGSRATVVVQGESGAGKEVIARALHDLSPRAAKPYVAFNCAAVPHDLFEGQLFGYRKGAFTGALADHAGVVRAADGGTLFLDEIGELPLDIQPKLLRFLDAGEVFPLGAERPLTVDVRVIAATNRDLAAEVRAGRFREDLFYRLHVVPLSVPPLRERRDDIVPLARYFLRTLTRDRARAPALSPDATDALRAHAWPGNVRELRNVVERALAYAPGRDVLTRAQLGM